MRLRVRCLLRWHFAAVVTRLALGGAVVASSVSIGEALTELIPIARVSSVGSLEIDGVRRSAPAVIDLDMGESHSIRIEIPGFRPYRAALARAAQGWLVGFDFVETHGGLLVDPSSGEVFQLSLAEMQGALLDVPSGEAAGTHHLELSVVNGHRRSWRKITRLEPLPLDPDAS